METKKQIMTVMTGAFVFFTVFFSATSARSEWHLMHPTKSDHVLRAIWGTSSDNIFAAGARGVFLHYDGARWQRMQAGTTRQIRDLHGIDASNVFAAGIEGAMFHYDGNMWSDISGPATNGITHHGVWANSPTDVFAVGEGGSIVHYDGEQWTKMASPTTNTLHCVWGTSLDNVYAGGAQSVLLHYDGTEWSPVETGFAMKHTIKDLWGDAANNIHGVGGSQEYKAYHIHYDGSQWTERLFDNAESTLQAVWGSGPDDVWAAGGNGRIHRWDGTSWTSFTRVAFCIHGLWGSSPSHIFAVGDSGSISRFDGVKWNDMAKREHNLQASCGLWGTSDSSVYSVGHWGSEEYGSVYHYDGSSWHHMASDATVDLNVAYRGIWGVSDSDVFAVGDQGAIIRYDGTVWRKMESGTDKDLASVWGTSAENVVAVGDDGTILRYDGSGWSVETSDTTDSLNAVWGVDSDHIFAVGANGTVVFYDGTHWEKMDSTTTKELEDIHGYSSNTVYAVGDQGTFLVYDGNGWSARNLSNVDSYCRFTGVRCDGQDLYAVFMRFRQRKVGKVDLTGGTFEEMLQFTKIYNPTATHRLWKSPDSGLYVGSEFQVFRYDFTASSWSAAFKYGDLFDVWGFSDTDVYAVGGSQDDSIPELNPIQAFASPDGVDLYGKVLHYDGDYWTELNPPVQSRWRAVWGAGSTVFVAGSNGRVLSLKDGAWTQWTSNTEKDVTGLSGTSENDVYAVGDGGVLLSFEGSEWTVEHENDTLDFNAVWAAAPSSVYIVGDDGYLGYFNGNSLELVDIDTTFDLVDIWGVSENDIWVVGASEDHGILVRKDANGWTKTEWGGRFSSVWGSSSSDVYAIRYHSKDQPNNYPYYNNRLSSWNGTQWIDLDPQFSIYLRPFSIWGTSSSDIFAVGWDQNIYRGPMPGFRVCPKHDIETGEDGSGTSFVVRMKSKPSADVTVSVASTDTTEATVSPATLTFTPSDWFVDQAVNVTGVNDDHEDGDVLALINVKMQSTDDPNYQIQDPDNSVVLNKDDGDKAGIATGDISSGVTTEGGASSAFTVVLESKPFFDVSFPFAVSKPGEGSVSPNPLVISPDQWDTPQTVTVAGVDDFRVDGDQDYQVSLEPTVSDDPLYNGIDLDVDFDLVNEDDDVAGITVGAISGHTGEDGATAAFSVTLDSQPEFDVSIPVSSTDAGEGTASPNPLTISPDQWNIPHQVAVTGQDDFVIDGDQDFQVVLGAATSDDPLYQGMDPTDVGVVNEDDDVAGFSVGQITGNTTEAGGTASFSVSLTCMPAHSVRIGVSSDDTTEGTVSPSFLEFDPEEWNVAQTVTAEGRDDAVADGDQAYRIVLGAAISDDNDFSGIDPADVDVVNTDNDTPGITASATDGNTTEAGGQARFTVQLNTEPTAQVQVAVQSLDSTEGSVSPSNLLFVPGNYDTPQTVVVTGVDDPTDDGDVSYGIQVGPTASEDPLYQGLGPRNVGVVNEDDEDAGFAISETDGSTEIDESGSTDRFSVVLESMPANGVVVLDVTSGDETEATVAPEALSFASDNWSIPQDVTVTGIDDNLPDGRQTATITVRVNTAGSSPEYTAVPAQNLDVANDGEPDADGVPAEIEDGAPNGGDGNGDGTPDSAQAHVASLPDAATGAYITVELTCDCDSLENVSTHAEDEFGNDASYDYPQGLTSFELPCAAATVVVYYHGLTPEEASVYYRKFQGGEQSPFFTFDGAVFGTATVAGQTVPTVTLTLADNQVGDLDDIVDRIKDPGGMARFNGTIPTVNVFGLALLVLAIGLAGWMKKTAKRSHL